MKRYLFILLLAGLFAAPASIAQTGHDHDAPQARQAIKDVKARFAKAWAEGDADGIASLYTADARFLAPNREPLTGREAIAQYFQGAIAAGFTIDLGSVEVEVLGDTAYEVGTYTLFAGSGQVVDRGKSLIIWKRDGGTWKLHRDMMNSSLPAPGQ